MNGKLNVIVVHLSSCHLLSGVCNLICDFFTNNIAVAFQHHTWICSFFSIVLLTVDRFWALQYPFVYRLIPLPSVYAVLVVLHIIFGVLLTIQLVCTNANIILMAMVIMVYFNVISLGPVNIFIILTRKKHLRGIEQNQEAKSMFDDTATLEGSDSSFTKARRTMPDSELRVNKKEQEKQIFLSKETRAVYLCAKIVLGFAVLWLPWAIHRTMALCGDDFYVLMRVATFLCPMNAVIDPVLLILFIRNLRRQVWNTISKRDQCGRVSFEG